MRTKQFISFISSYCLFAASLFSQQVADTLYNPVIRTPQYPAGTGPVVAIDEGHNNFHTAEGRYLPFARVLRNDGYNVIGWQGDFGDDQHMDIRILVIANALNKINVENWYLPTPSAFTSQEINALTKWVKGGGSLFLIADHMPMGGAAADLAASFGFHFTNGFAADTNRQGADFFTRKNGMLKGCSITNGRNSMEYVSSVTTFRGQAFRIPPEATPVLLFEEGYLLLESDTAWIFDSRTRYTPIRGWAQGACSKYGKGRVVMFGEAAMFTAQLAGPGKVKTGMNSDFAGENYKLLLNIIHWLDGKMD